MIKMRVHKFFGSVLFFVCFILFFVGGVSADVYNQNGDFSIDIDSLKQITYTDNVEAVFDLKVKNNFDVKQKFYVNVDHKKGWVINSNLADFTLNAGEEKVVTLKFKTNMDFDYGTSVVTPDIIKISQKDSYVGSFEFPVLISGEGENVSLKLGLDVEKKEKPREVYSAQISGDAVSPTVPLGFVVNAENIEEEQEVEISLEFADKEFEFEDKFSPESSYKIYQQRIPSSIAPEMYDVKITIRLTRDDSDKVVWEWTEEKEIEVNEYRNLSVKESVDKTFFKTIETVEVSNGGNIDETYEKEVNHSIVKGLFFFTQSLNIEDTNSGVKFVEELEKGESKTIVYEYNYVSIYAILLILILFGSYVYVRKKSNPLDVETKIYEVKTVKHEGVKSLKVRVGFENIKEQDIDKLRVVLKMPTYLSVKDKSFLLTQPNKVLKGKKYYKLMWDFKKLEQNDSRILGFTLVNTKGILGDIRLPPVEFEVRRGSKTRKYRNGFPIING